MRRRAFLAAIPALAALPALAKAAPVEAYPTCEEAMAGALWGDSLITPEVLACQAELNNILSARIDSLFYFGPGSGRVAVVDDP